MDRSLNTEQEFLKEAPQWVTDLHQDLETLKSTRAECSHERMAYQDAALMVEEYWRDRDAE